MGRLEVAILNLDKALKIFPEFTEVLADKGAVLIKLQRYEEGLDTLNKALEYKPNYTIALTNKRYLSKQLKEKGIDIKILEKKGKIELNCHKCGNQVFYGENYCYDCGAQIGKNEGKVLSEDKIKDSEIFLDLIYNEKFDLAIKCLENQIYPLVAQNHAFGQVKPMNKFVPLRFSAEKENHLIKDQNNLIKFQSGKYNWKSYIPKGKLVKIYKGLYWAHGYTIHDMNESERKYFHRDELVKWIFDNLCRSSEFGMEIIAIDTPKESITILKNDKITMYLTDQFPASRLQSIKAMIKHNIDGIPINWILNEIMHVAHLRESEIMALLAEKKKQSGKEWDEKDAIIEIALERGVDIRTKSLEDFIEEVDFNSVPLSEFYPIFESESLDEPKKIEVFDKIVNKIDVSDNFVGLLDLITHSSDPPDHWADPLDYRHVILGSFYSKVLQNYPEVLTENFPEILITNRKLESAAQIMTFSLIVHPIKNTDIMKKHFYLIEDEFKKLLEFFYNLPYDVVKKFHSKCLLFTHLKDIVKGTELLRSDVPNFSKLIKYYPSFEDEEFPLVKNFHYFSPQPGGEPQIEYSLKRIEGFEVNFLLSLYGVIKGQNYKMMEVQYISLIIIFERLLDQFDDIQRDEDAFALFSKFFKALKHEKSAPTEETLMKKISKFTLNLSIIKERYPEMWEEYEKYNRDQSPELLGENYFTKKGLFRKVGSIPLGWKEGPDLLDLLESKIPYFAKLIELISWDEPRYMQRLGKFDLLSLTGLIKGQPLMEKQWSYLLFVFEKMIDNFYKIQMDKESIQLFFAVSSFGKILLQKKPEIIKQIFINKILLFTANLNAIKKRFPKEWNESLNNINSGVIKNKSECNGR